MMLEQRRQSCPTSFDVRKPIWLRRQILADQKVARTTNQKRHSDNTVHVKILDSELVQRDHTP